ncbi:MAG: hypothetical protein IBX56_04580 [Methylomicrobium sp.]|nr:hypothetical protein [Methylomicrobium sp.]
MTSDNTNLEQTLSPLLDRVVTILEQARSNVVQSVNHNTVLANWLIGREIVQQLQQGNQRAEHGKQVIQALSERLNRRYGKGFSTTNLSYFRQFYLTYSDRIQILHPMGGELTTLPLNTPETGQATALQTIHPMGGQTTFSPLYQGTIGFIQDARALLNKLESRNA